MESELEVNKEKAAAQEAELQELRAAQGSMEERLEKQRLSLDQAKLSQVSLQQRLKETASELQETHFSSFHAGFEQL